MEEIIIYHSILLLLISILSIYNFINFDLHIQKQNQISKVKSTYNEGYTNKDSYNQKGKSVIGTNK